MIAPLTSGTASSMLERMAQARRREKAVIGRPRRTEALADHQVKIRLTTGEYAAWSKAARASDTTVVSWARDLGNRAAARQGAH